MLKINRLKLHNFMCVADADLDFTNNKLILLIGNNGAGKSTVLSAIALCLLETKRSDSYKENVKLGEKSASVELEAEINGKPLDISINLSSTSSTMTRVAHYDGKNYNNSEVSSLLETFDLKYYSDIIMSVQGAGDITKLSPSQREVYLQKLLNFDFSEQVETCKTNLKDLNEKISYNNSQIDFSKKMIQQRLGEIKNPTPLDFTENDILKKEQEKESLNKELTVLSNNIRKRNILLQKKNSLMNDTLFPLKQNLTKISSSLEFTKENQKKINSLNLENNSILENIKSLEESLKTNTLQLNEIDNEISTISKARDSILDAISTIKAEMQHSQQHLSLIEKGQCPECGHKFEATDKESYQKEFNSCKNSLQEQNQKLSDIENSLSDYTSTKQKTQQSISSINSNIASEKAKISQININISSLQKSIDEAKENEKKMADFKKRIEEVNLEISNIDNEISSIANSDDEYQNLSRKIDSIQQEISSLKNRLTEYNIIVKNNKDIESNIAELNKTISESEKLVENYRSQYTTYDEAQKVLDKALPQYLILKTCNLLEEDINNFVHIIFPKMGVYLFQSKKGVEFFYTTDITKLPENFEKTDLMNVKMTSGFEKAVISIAFKVCLCKAYGLSFAFMDEIDEAGTDENSELLFRSILSNDLFNQLFIISHKPMVRDVIQNLATQNVTYYVKNGVFSIDEN